MAMANLRMNPQGLLPNHLWQMDVTHITEFGKLKMCHSTNRRSHQACYKSLFKMFCLHGNGKSYKNR